MTCDRCNKPLVAWTMSYFNRDVICMPCRDKERRHRDYTKAVERESEAVARGDYNFPGIGKPADL
jgi:hypothetical protein